MAGYICSDTQLRCASLERLKFFLYDKHWHKCCLLSTHSVILKALNLACWWWQIMAVRMRPLLHSGLLHITLGILLFYIIMFEFNSWSLCDMPVMVVKSLKVHFQNVKYLTYILIYLPTYSLTPWSRVLEKLTSFQLVKKFPTLWNPKCSLPHSHMPTTCPFPEPDQSSPCPHIPLPEDSSKLYPPIYAWVSQMVSFPQVSSTKTCIHLSSPPY